MNKFNNLNLKWKLAVGFSIPLFLLVIIAVVVSNNLSRLLESNKWVTHTHEVIKSGNEVGTALINMETGFRGYMIVGEQAYLEPYEKGEKTFAEVVQYLKQKVSDNPKQVDRLKQVEAIKEKWVNEHVELSTTIRDEVNKGERATLIFNKISARLVGKEKFDGFRAALANLENTFKNQNDNQALFLTQSILLDMVNQETGQRGYLLSGVEASLEPFNSGIISFKENISRLKSLVNNRYGASELNQVNQIQELSEQWSNLAAIPEIEARRAMNEVNKNVNDISIFIKQGIGKKYMDEMRGILDLFIAEESKLIEIRAQEQASISSTTSMVTILGTIISLILGGFIAWITTKLISKPIIQLTQKLSQVQQTSDFSIRATVTSPDEVGQASQAFNEFMDETQEAFNSINNDLNEFSKGDYSVRIENDTKGDLKLLNDSCNSLLEKIDNNEQAKIENDRVEKEKQTQQKIISDSNERLKQALDVCNTSVMVADPDLNIIYMNQSTEKMMSDAEADIKTALPRFNAQKLMGENIDVFHKNPAHQRNMLKELTQTYTVLIKVGPLDMQVVATPINNAQGERLGYAVEWQNQTEMLAKQKEQQRIADGNARIKQALDNVTTNAMIADNDRNIVYMNKSVAKMMKERERTLKEVLPNFDAHNLLSEKIDVFHKNPAHQENLLRNLTSTYATEIEVNGLTFGLIANPVFDENNNRIGSVVEWKDRTEEVSVEREIDQLVESASSGDLTTRIDLKGKDGFFEKLGVGLNRLLGISEGVVNDTARVLDALAHGDLSQKIDQDYQGSFGKLKKDANATVDKLTEIISSIRDAASSVSTGADEIAQGNTDLSQRTEEQASSLEETASSMEEMTSTVRQSAENAGKANQLSRDASSKAEEGGNVVKEAVTAMAEINDSSKKISDIIGVIDEIAFQTNLLALNAAVEAARAGEQGRGFAVVAGEVRSLAQRSAGAAKEIKDLIRDSGEKVDAGTDLVNKSGSTLKEIVDSVQEVSSMIADITAASEEQASGIDQVNKAVSQMDEMTQQNAALVEEATSAGEAMSEQARSMMQMMKFFSTDANAQRSTSSMQTTIKQESVQPRAVASNSNSLRKPMQDPGGQWQEF